MPRCVLSCAFAVAGSLALSCLAGLPLSVQAAEPTISTVAGGCVSTALGCSGDVATEMSLTWTKGIAADQSSFYVAANLSQVYRVDSGGRYSVFAGKGSGSYYDGDGGPATAAGLNPVAVAVDAQGNVFVADKANQRIRRIARNGIITTVAGNGQPGFSGDGGLATSARLNQPDGVAVDGSGNLYILDRGNHRIRKVSNGIITSIAGNGVPGYAGDNGLARLAQLNDPQGIAADAFGNVVVADTGNARIRRISPDGLIRTIAGGGLFEVDSLATNMRLPTVLGVAVDPTGNVLFSTHHAVHRIEPDGVRRTVAGLFDEVQALFRPEGPGVEDDYGDGGPAVGANLQTVEALAFDHAGNLLIADDGLGRVRKVTPIPAQPLQPRLDAFSARQRIPLAGEFGDVAIADMNGDGRNDVVVSSKLGRFAHDPEVDLRIHILLQRPDGTLDAPRTVRYAADPTWQPSHDGGHLAIADFNGDGIADAAVSRTGGVDVVLGSRTASFAATTFHQSEQGSAFLDIVAIDLNHDGHVDIIAHVVERLHYIFGNGVTGPTGATKEYTLGGIGLMRTGDFNGDGRDDLVYTFDPDAGGENAIAVRTRSNSAQMFDPPTLFPAGVMRWPHGLAVGDLDGDGRADIAFDAPADDHPNLTRLGTILQRAPGVLTMQPGVRTYNTPSQLHIADLDRDGRPDIVSWMTGVAPLWGTAGGFVAGRKWSVAVPEGAIETHTAVGDVNGDGRPDVVVAVSDGGVDVLYGNLRPASWRAGGGPLAPPRDAALRPAGPDVAPSRQQARDLPQPATARVVRSSPGVASTAAGWRQSLRRELRTLGLKWTAWRLQWHRRMALRPEGRDDADHARPPLPAILRTAPSPSITGDAGKHASQPTTSTWSARYWLYANAAQRP